MALYKFTYLLTYFAVEMRQQNVSFQLPNDILQKRSDKFLDNIICEKNSYTELYSAWNIAEVIQQHVKKQRK